MDIRDPADREAEQVIALVRRGLQHISPSMVRALVTEPASAHERVVLVAVRDGEVVGAGLQFRLPEIPPTQCARYVVVAPASLGTGIARALAAELDDRLDPAVTDVTTTVDDHDEHALAVADHWGFRRLQHSLTFELDLGDLPPLVLPPHVSVELSYDLVLADEAAVEAMLEASQTNPEREHNGPLTLGQLRAWVAPGSGDVPIGVVLRIGGRPAALSHGIVGGEVVQVVYTGVHPGLRGHGLAAMAKQALHLAARDAGATRAQTSNEEQNLGIQRVNQQLGYRRTSGVVWLHRQLG